MLSLAATITSKTWSQPLLYGDFVVLSVALTVVLIALVCALWSRHRLKVALQQARYQKERSQQHRSQTLEILEHTTDAFFQTDKNYTIQYANDKAAEILRRPPDTLQGATLWDLFPENISSTFFYEFRHSQSRGTSAEFETLYAPDQTWFSVHAYPSKEAFSIYFRDITDKKEAETALKKSEARYRALFDSLGDGAFVYRGNRLLDMNTVGCQNLGYSRQQLLELDLSDIDPLLSGPGADLMLSQLKRTGSASFETEHLRADGSRLPVWVNARMIDYQGGSAVLAIARDMTDRRNQDRQLEQLATTDPLTNAFNRRYFMENARRFTKRARRGGEAFTLMMLDLDHFKRVNDTYGHEFGDRALIHFSQICLQKLRGHDLFCRLGGEEFAALLPGLDLGKAHQVAERLRKALEESSLKSTEGESVQFTVSIGLAHSADISRLNHNRLLAMADKALYAAKEGGRNQVRLYQTEESLEQTPSQEEQPEPC